VRERLKQQKTAE